MGPNNEPLPDGTLPLTSSSAWLQYFEVASPRRGDLDLLCVGPTPSAGTAGRAFALTCSMLQNEEGTWLFDHVVIAKKGAADRSPLEYLREGLADQQFLDDSPIVRDRLSGCLRFASLAHLADLPRQMDGWSASAIFVEVTPTKASQSHAAPTASGVWLPGDVWAKQFTEVATAARSVAKENDLYVLVYVADYAPVTHSLALQLTTQADAVVLVSNTQESNARTTAVEYWNRLASAGRLDEALERIEATMPSGVERQLTKAQAEISAGRRIAAYQHLRAIADQLDRCKDGVLLLDAARVAHFSLEFDTCRKLLRAAWARGVAGPNALALAASLGRRHECDDVAQAASEALLSAHPDSVQAVKERLRCATTADDLRELLAHPLLAGDIAALSEEMRATRILAEELATEDPLRSIAAAERLRSNLVEPEQLAASLLTCIAHAISAGAIGSA